MANGYNLKPKPGYKIVTGLDGIQSYVRDTSKKGSARATGKPKTNSAPDPASAFQNTDPWAANFIGSGDDHSFVTQYNDPAPMYRPLLQPGSHGKLGSTYAPGIIFADKVANPAGPGTPTGNPYGFRFHYNPASISMSSQADIDFTNQPNQDTGNQFFNNYGSCSFQFLVNRQDEVRANKKFPQTVLNTTSFSDLGTMYDVEWLFRVFNGDPKLGPGGTNETAMQYYLKATPVHVIFNKGMRYFGRPASIDVQHILFNANMVPTVTTVQLTLAGMVDSSVSSNTNLTGFTTVKINGKKYKVKNGWSLAPISGGGYKPIPD